MDTWVSGLVLVITPGKGPGRGSKLGFVGFACGPVFSPSQQQGPAGSWIRGEVWASPCLSPGEGHSTGSPVLAPPLQRLYPQHPESFPKLQEGELPLHSRVPRKPPLPGPLLFLGCPCSKQVTHWITSPPPLYLMKLQASRSLLYPQGQAQAVAHRRRAASVG